MQFRVANQTGDVVVLQQRIGEDVGRGEAGPCSGYVAYRERKTYGNSAMEAAQSEICSRWASSSVMVDMHGARWVGRGQSGGDAGVNTQRATVLGIALTSSDVKHLGASTLQIHLGLTHTSPSRPPQLPFLSTEPLLPAIVHSFFP